LSSGSPELRTVLERIEDRLYRAWMLQGLLAYAYWLLILEGYMVVVFTSWFASLRGGLQCLVGMAYWLGLGVPGFYVAVRHWRRYYRSLEAASELGVGRSSRCGLSGLGWVAGFLMAPPAAALLEGVYGGERLVALSVLLAVTVGSWGNVLGELCLGFGRRGVPPSLYAAAILALAVPGLLLAPADAYGSVVFSSSAIGLAYTASIIAYGLASLRGE
jgi:hypothetical protein